MIALQAIRLAVRGLAEAMNDAREYAVQTGEELAKVYDKLREVKAIRGDKTIEKTTAATADIMMSSGMTLDEAAKFETMWGSTIPAAKQKGHWHLDDAQTTALKREAAKMAATNAIDPGVMGKMVAGIGISEDVTTVEGMLEKLDAMHALGIEAVSQFTPIMQVEAKLRPAMLKPGGGGAARTSEELMAIASARTVDEGAPGRTSFSVEQIWKALSVVDNEKKKEMFAKVGIVTGQDDYQTSLHKIAKVVDQAKAEGRNPQEALIAGGIAGIASRKIVEEVENLPVIDARLAAARAPHDANKIRDANAEFNRKNRKRFADAAGNVADWKRGEEMIDLVAERENARAGLERRHEIDMPGWNLAEGLHTITTLGGLTSEKGREAHLDQEVRRRLLSAVPGIGKRFPELGQWEGDKNISRATAEGTRLGEIIRGLSDEDKAAFRAEMDNFARSGNRGVRIPAQRRGAAARPGPARPVRPGDAVIGPQAGADMRRLEGVNFDQLRVLASIDRKLGGGARGANGTGGALPLDGGGFGPMRA